MVGPTCTQAVRDRRGGAYKVSYNRPFHTRVYEFYSWVFNAEYTGAAPPSGAVVSLNSSNTNVAQVPSSTTISAGSTSVTYTVTTSPVHGTSAGISGTYTGTTRSATLTVK
jgi:hypothetical protein